MDSLNRSKLTSHMGIGWSCASLKDRAATAKGTQVHKGTHIPATWCSTAPKMSASLTPELLTCWCGTGQDSMQCMWKFAHCFSMQICLSENREPDPIQWSFHSNHWLLPAIKPYCPSSSLPPLKCNKCNLNFFSFHYYNRDDVPESCFDALRPYFNTRLNIFLGILFCTCIVLYLEYPSLPPFFYPLILYSLLLYVHTKIFPVR